MEEQQKERQSREVQQDLIQSQPHACSEHQAEQPQDQHVKWVNTRKGEEKNQPSKNENGRVTVENPTKRELIGRPIITGRRKGLERRRYDTAV